MKEAKDYIGVTKQMKDGYFCTVIGNNGKTRVIVQYEDGIIKTHRSLKNFLNGVLEKNTIKVEHIGETRMMKCGMECTIINYRGYHNIDVQFKDGTIVNNRCYKWFLEGKILNNKILHNYHLVENLVGKSFGHLTVLKYDKTDKYGMTHWICRCSCGNIKSIIGKNLKNGYSKSCGCLKSKLASERCKKNTKTNKLKDEHPELIKYLVNKEDGELTLSVTNKIKCMCPICNTYRTYSSMSTFISHGFTCPNCSSKISCPNRFMFKVLNQLNIEFKTEKIFKWSNKKRYDFYIPSLSCIIEVQGNQHYRDSQWSKVEYQQQNDKLKETLALSNGIKIYIQLDCKNSDFKYMKQSILNNDKINKLFDLSKIDWDAIEKELKEV